MNDSRIARPKRPQLTCIYCGAKGFTVRKGEHIFPNAMGGVRTIKEVCPKCNNGVLSEIDDHLISSSPMALVAGGILGKGVRRTWDVDEHANRMLLEAAPDWKTQSMTLWPQLILTDSGIALRADHEAIQSFGIESFPKMFLRKVRRAYEVWNHCKGKKLFFEQLGYARELEEGYSYPPRVFARKTIEEVAKGEETFFVGYSTERDKRRILAAISNLDLNQPLKFNRSLGSARPLVTRCWDHLKVLRALTKIGINLLYDCCKQTTVDRCYFKNAIGFVIGTKFPTKEFLNSNGFVSPLDLADIHRNDSGHSARLSYCSGVWTVEIAFFGGQVCAVIQIPGPCKEPWTSCTVGTPLARHDRDVSADWKFTTSSLLIPRKYHFSWNDPSVIIPSVDLLNVQIKSLPTT